MDSEKCGAVYPYAWDARGSFVCKKPGGHGGIHKARSGFTWSIIGQTGGKEDA